VETTGGNEYRPPDEEVTLPDDEAATPFESTDDEAAEPFESTDNEAATPFESTDDEAAAPFESTGDEAATPFEATDTADADVYDVPEDSPFDVGGDPEAAIEAIEGEEADVEPVETDAVGPGDSEDDGSTEASRLEKIRSLAHFRVDTKWLRSAWNSHSLGRIALLAVLVYAVTAGSAYFLVLQPLSTRLHTVREQKNILHDYAVIEEAGAAISEFKEGLMTGDQRMTFMSEVNLMAEASGVKLIGDPDLLAKREGSGHFVEYPVRLRMKGTYHEIGAFLSLLERSPRFAIVEDVEVRSDVDSSNRDSEATVLISLAAWEG